MSLGDLVREADIFDLLHSDDCKIVISARGVLKEAPINGFLSGDNIDRMWFDKNIKSQEELLQLKTRVEFISNKFQLDLYKLEGDTVLSGEFDHIKTRDERISTMVASDSSIRDRKESLDNLKTILLYLDGLLWSLIDLMKLFKK